MRGDEIQIKNNAAAGKKKKKILKGCKKIVRQRELIIEDSGLLGHYVMSSRNYWRF
jgi:hypothetical protein